MANCVVRGDGDEMIDDGEGEGTVILCETFGEAARQ